LFRKEERDEFLLATKEYKEGGRTFDRVFSRWKERV
jgi:hypothetical protein